MSLRAQLDPNFYQLCFEKYPAETLAYLRFPPWHRLSCVPIEVTNSQTEKKISIYLPVAEIERIGISLASWKGALNDEARGHLIEHASIFMPLLQKAIPLLSQHLEAKYLEFFEEQSPFISRRITEALHHQLAHSAGCNTIPGIYLFDSGCVGINLKKTKIGKGGNNKVKKFLWLDPKEMNPVVVAKKVSSTFNGRADFNRELMALAAIPKNEVGIIYLIAAKVFHKSICVLPLYPDGDLSTLLVSKIPLSLDEKLSMAWQLLKGLATIAKVGVHGDLKPDNFLLNRKEGFIGIADFGSFRPHGEQTVGRFSIYFISPDFLATQGRNPLPNDIWAMGMSLYTIFSNKGHPYMKIKTKREVCKLLSELSAHWIWEYLAGANAPRFVLDLIDAMLDPDPKKRPTAAEALDFFSDGVNQRLFSYEEDSPK